MTQLNFDTHCEMNFRFYPFDKQVGQLENGPKKVQQVSPKRRTEKRLKIEDQSVAKVCSLNIEAFGHGEEDINLNWKVENIVDEIQIDKVASLISIFHEN